jgi:hypothetical protein
MIRGLHSQKTDPGSRSERGKSIAEPCKSTSKSLDINMMRVNFYRVEGNGIVECQNGRFLTPPQENKCLLRENSSGTKSKLVL